MFLGLCYVFIAETFIEFAAVGIGVHHAGVSFDDRRVTEQLYLKKVLRILVATSVRNYIFCQLPNSFMIFFQTLAVGVNLRKFKGYFKAEC